MQNTTENMTSADKANAVTEHEAYTTGTEQLIRHNLGMLYTEGMAFMAETCGAYWLLDLVASHQPAIAGHGTELASFQVWTLEQAGSGWVVSAWSDTPGHDSATLLASQVVPFSDFPAELSGWCFYYQNGTAMMRGEN